MPITGITIEADSVVVKGSDFDALCGLATENNRLRQELSLAEEGLANYELEVQRLRKAIFMAHAEMGEENACGCICDDCRAYITGDSHPHPTTNEEES